MLMRMKLQTSTSFRALSLNFAIIKTSLNLMCKTPSHTTLLNWVHKIGYYELTKAKKSANDWIIILDESIQLGKEKVLVVFGVRESKIDFTRPLRFQDLVPLREITKENWNSELIKDVLVKLQNELGYIKYAVGDHGSYLKKGIELSGIKHVHDLTHKIGLIIKKICTQYPDFNNWALEIKKLRKKFAQTDIAFIIPPKLRSKCRYRNLMILSKWGMDIVSYLKNNNNDNRLDWILDYEEIIKDYFELSNVICKIEKILKTNGLKKSTFKECESLLQELNTKPGEVLKKELLKYFNETKLLIPKTNKILVSSDIIESAFGKYKNYISSNPMAGVTNLILCISAFTSDLKEKDVKKALENTTINEVKEWTKEFVGDTLLRRRRIAFS